jgi:hypothetical protein
MDSFMAMMMTLKWISELPVYFAVTGANPIQVAVAVFASV